LGGVGLRHKLWEKAHGRFISKGEERGNVDLSRGERKLDFGGEKELLVSPAKVVANCSIL